MRDLRARRGFGREGARVAACARCEKRCRWGPQRAFAAALLACLVTAVSAHAERPDAMPGLDQQVQEIKSDVLAIATELQQLEEKLLYPSDTQVAVFVALAAEESLELDSIEVRIDGEPVARHVYEWKELEALRKGGVQRLYTGNLTTGEHRLEVSLVGKLSGGSEFQEAGSFAFEKGVEPKVLDLTVAGRAVGGVRIELGDG